MKFDPVQFVTTNEIKIEKLEALTGIILPEYLKVFFRKYAGQCLKVNGASCTVVIKHLDGSTSSSSIQQVETVESSMNVWGMRDYLFEYQEHFELSDNYVQAEHLFPIIELPNAEIYVAINGLHDKKIYYVDNGDFGIIKIANFLNEFLENLR